MATERPRIVELGFRHHRKVGERDGRLKAGTALGRQAWYMGYRPSYLILRALYRARENAAALAMVCGYGWAAVSGAPAVLEPHDHEPGSGTPAAPRRRPTRRLELSISEPGRS